ncbi:bifunctional dTDP-4-dehydrorhamnose 3,5-epimerase/dTDP-4-dehydrorhamnose reductase [Dorcoceras hygrometricum]|uniref:Bifunctional dTDP-4-dehydrorhamnose 3,5-epimerase/dTDP-4-dehydrorhamnose reductase n=1 Tax=Dorcoceras hygrometricum TaxID=472368 RepID=A0A2Z7DER5_9LAMI|nr:bifunctional dTDP-4-dehydrorhamnose 3,5-epimerase/dTDP-4-dehydrorhamnose reductase [Dorcoceras hygrometricum]
MYGGEVVDGRVVEEAEDLLKDYDNVCTPRVRMAISTDLGHPRATNDLDATKLKQEFPQLMSIKDSLIQYVFSPNRKKAVA